MNIFSMLCQCTKRFSSADICIIVIMIIPKLLLIMLLFTFFVAPQNVSHRGLVLRKMPIQGPVTDVKIREISYDNRVTSNNNNVSNIIIQKNNLTSSVSYLEVTERPILVDVTIKKAELMAKKYDVTIVYPENYIEKHSSVIFQSNEELPDATTLTPINTLEQRVDTIEALSTTNNPIIEKNAVTTNYPDSTSYEQPKSDTPESLSVPTDKDVSNKTLSEVATPTIPLEMKSDNNLKSILIRPFIFRQNLKTFLRRNQAVNQPVFQPNLNEQPKQYVSTEQYVNTETPTWNLSDDSSSTVLTTTSTSTTKIKPVTRPIPERNQRQFYSVNRLHSYTCKNVNGYYSYSNGCDVYVECKNNIAYRRVCPDGLHFDSAATWPAYPCAYPSEVKCLDQSITQKKQFSDECPRSYGFFPVPKGDCGHFIMCQEGSAITMSCPPGLAFNSIRSNCDWPVNVPDCNPNIFQDFICPTTPLNTFDEPSHVIYNYRYKESCKKYIACQEGRPRLLSCEAGLSFDENAQKCVNSNLITDCID